MVLTKQQWDELWRPIDPLSPENRALNPGAYAKKVAEHWRRQDIAPRYTSNGRYEVYLELLLQEGVVVPDEIIAQVDPEANRYHDVPLVGARLAPCGINSGGAT